VQLRHKGRPGAPGRSNAVETRVAASPAAHRHAQHRDDRDTASRACAGTKKPMRQLEDLVALFRERGIGVLSHFMLADGSHAIRSRRFWKLFVQGLFVLARWGLVSRARSYGSQRPDLDELWQSVYCNKFVKGFADCEEMSWTLRVGQAYCRNLVKGSPILPPSPMLIALERWVCRDWTPRFATTT